MTESSLEAVSTTAFLFSDYKPSILATQVWTSRIVVGVQLWQSAPESGVESEQEFK